MTDLTKRDVLIVLPLLLVACYFLYRMSGSEVTVILPHDDPRHAFLDGQQTLREDVVGLLENRGKSINKIFLLQEDMRFNTEDESFQLLISKFCTDNNIALEVEYGSGHMPDFVHEFLSWIVHECH